MAAIVSKHYLDEKIKSAEHSLLLEQKKLDKKNLDAKKKREIERNVYYYHGYVSALYELKNYLND